MSSSQPGQAKPFLFYFSVVLVAASSVAFGLDWTVAPLPPMHETEASVQAAKLAAHVPPPRRAHDQSRHAAARRATGATGHARAAVAAVNPAAKPARKRCRGARHRGARTKRNAAAAGKRAAEMRHRRVHGRLSQRSAHRIAAGSLTKARAVSAIRASRRSTSRRPMRMRRRRRPTCQRQMRHRGLPASLFHLHAVRLHLSAVERAAPALHEGHAAEAEGGGRRGHCRCERREQDGRGQDRPGDAQMRYRGLQAGLFHLHPVRLHLSAVRRAEAALHQGHAAEAGRGGDRSGRRRRQCGQCRGQSGTGQARSGQAGSSAGGRGGIQSSKTKMQYRSL